MRLSYFLLISDAKFRHMVFLKFLKTISFIFVIVFVWSNVLIWSYVDFILRWAYLCFGWQPLTILDPHTLSRNEYHLNLMSRRPAKCKSFMCRQVYEPSALCEQMLAMCNTLLLTCLSFLSLCFCHLIKHMKHVWMLKSTAIESFSKITHSANWCVHYVSSLSLITSNATHSIAQQSLTSCLWTTVTIWLLLGNWL